LLNKTDFAKLNFETVDQLSKLTHYNKPAHLTSYRPYHNVTWDRLNKHIEGTAGNQLIPLSVQTLPAGTYFLRLNGERSLVKQFVKQDW